MNECVSGDVAYRHFVSLIDVIAYEGKSNYETIAF